MMIPNRTIRQIAGPENTKHLFDGTLQLLYPQSEAWSTPALGRRWRLRILNQSKSLELGHAWSQSVSPCAAETAAPWGTGTQMTHNTSSSWMLMGISRAGCDHTCEFWSQRPSPAASFCTEACALWNVPRGRKSFTEQSPPPGPQVFKPSQVSLTASAGLSRSQESQRQEDGVRGKVVQSSVPRLFL